MTCDLHSSFLLKIWKKKPCQGQVWEQAHSRHQSEDPSEADGKVEQVGSYLGVRMHSLRAAKTQVRRQLRKVSIQPLGKVAFLLKHTAPSTGKKK